MAEALATGRASSRFSFVRSAIATPLTWTSPEQSGAVFCGVAAFFVSYVYYRWSLLSIFGHLATIMLALAATISVHNGLQPHATFPQLIIPLDRATVIQLSVLIADRASLLVEAANQALSWDQPMVSVKAVAYAWLASRLAWLAAPGYFLTCAYLLHHSVCLSPSPALCGALSLHLILRGAGACQKRIQVC